ASRERTPDPQIKRMSAVLSGSACSTFSSITLVGRWTEPAIIPDVSSERSRTSTRWQLPVCIRLLASAGDIAEKWCFSSASLASNVNISPSCKSRHDRNEVATGNRCGQAIPVFYGALVAVNTDELT